MMDRVQLKKELSRDEGVRPHIYKDSLGIPSIGIGHNLRNGPLSQRVIDMIYEEDVATAIAELDKHLPWYIQLSDARQRVLVNMCFNLGITKLLKFKATLSALQSGAWDRASAGMLSSLWARQVGQRAVRLAEMVRLG